MDAVQPAAISPVRNAAAHPLIAPPDLYFSGFGAWLRSPFCYGSIMIWPIRPNDDLARRTEEPFHLSLATLAAFYRRFAKIAAVTERTCDDGVGRTSRGAAIGGVRRYGRTDDRQSRQRPGHGRCGHPHALLCIPLAMLHAKQTGGRVKVPSPPVATMRLDLSGPLLESLTGKRQSFSRERSR